MKLAVIVGHNEQQQGAVRRDTGETEFAFNSRVADVMERRALEVGLDVKVFHRRKQGGYTAEIREVYGAADIWGADATVELHFNGSGDDEVTGTETLSSGSKLSLQLAHAVQDELVTTLGLRDRGVKTRASADRGGKSLHTGKAPAILTEPFFGSSAQGTAATDSVEEVEALAMAQLRGAARAMVEFPRSDLKHSRTMDAAVGQRKAQVVQISSGAAAAVAQTATQMKDTIEELPLSGVFETYVPYVTLALVAISMAATLYMRVQTTRIEVARREDHARGVR